MNSFYEKKMIYAQKHIKNIPEYFRSSSPSKISLHPDNSFCLPAGCKYSCCGETEECRKSCYAKRHNFSFDGSVNLVMNNWLLIKYLDINEDVEVMTKLLSKIIPEDINIYRIHESGEFFSQHYLDAWTQVIRNHPKVKFWAYTRNFNLNYQKAVRQANFNLLASTDLCNIKEATKFVKRYENSQVKHAYGPWRQDQALPKNSFVCPSTNGKIDHVGACEKCKLCVIKGKCKKHVVFPKR